MNVPNLKNNARLLSNFSRAQPPSDLSKQQTQGDSLRCSNEARDPGYFFAYVIMPDHIHLITGGRSISDHRFTNITAKRAIDYLREHNLNHPLPSLSSAANGNINIRFSIIRMPSRYMDRYDDAKVNYVHLNPCAWAWWNKRR